MKTFKQFLEETNLILERRKYDDESHGFDRRLSKKEKKELELEYDTPSETKEGQRHSRETNNPNPRHGFTLIHHKPSGIKFEITHKVPENKDPWAKEKPRSHMAGQSKISHGHKPLHDVQWYPSQFDTSNLSDHEKYKLGRSAAKVWKRHIEPRIPSGHLITNSPDTPELEHRYRRRGFGSAGHSGRQYATKIGNKLHPVNPDK